MAPPFPTLRSGGLSVHFARHRGHFTAAVSAAVVRYRSRQRQPQPFFFGGLRLTSDTPGRSSLRFALLPGGLRSSRRSIRAAFTGLRYRSDRLATLITLSGRHHHPADCERHAKQQASFTSLSFRLTPARSVVHSALPTAIDRPTTNQPADNLSTRPLPGAAFRSSGTRHG
jgi:hypothetical protein